MQKSDEIIKLYKNLLIKKDMEIKRAIEGWADASSDFLELEEKYKSLLLSSRVLEQHLYKLINELFKTECFNFSTKTTFERSIAQVFEDFYDKYQGPSIDI